MRKSGVTIIELLLVISIIVVVACLFITCKFQVSKRYLVQQTVLSTVEKVGNTSPVPYIKDFGNGVRYFPFTGEEFGKKLGEFLGNNTNLEVSAMAGEVTKQGYYSSTFGVTTGYFVTFREKKSDF